MSRSSLLLPTLALLLSFVGSGCDAKPWRKWMFPEVHSTPGTVTEVRKAVTVPVVVKNAKGEMVRAYVVAHPGWLVGPPPVMSEVK